jgi:aspartyl protease
MMRKLTLTIASTALLFVCAISARAQPSSVAIAPLQMRGWMPVVEVKLNGQGPFAFMIDTGAGMQADIDTTVAERLGLQPSGMALNGDPSGENDQAVATTTIDSIVLGGTSTDRSGSGNDRPAGGTRERRVAEPAKVVEFRNVTAVVRPQKITKDYPAVDGILGFALFADYLLTLDYPAMQVRLARGALPAVNGADILSFEIENRIPIVELAIGKIRVRAHIDSGNFVAGFILPEEIVEQLQLLSEPVTVGRARSVSNQIDLNQVQLKDTIRIGGFDFPQAVITFPALSDANVGFKVLRDFVLTFDQKNRRVKLERSR